MTKQNKKATFLVHMKLYSEIHISYGNLYLVLCVYLSNCIIKIIHYWGPIIFSFNRCPHISLMFDNKMKPKISFFLEKWNYFNAFFFLLLKKTYISYFLCRGSLQVKCWSIITYRSFSHCFIHSFIHWFWNTCLVINICEALL